MTRRTALSAAVAVLALAGFAHAASITYNEASPSYAAVRCGQYPQTSGDWSEIGYGIGHLTLAGTESLLRWNIDLTGMPSISSATLTLNFSAAYEFPAGDILQVSRVTGDWSASSAPQPRPGIDGSYLTLVSNGQNTQTFDLQPIVQYWLAHPGSDYGFAFTSDATCWPATSGCYRFFSPCLTVTPGTAPVPEPTTLTLAGLGALGFFGSVIRRRAK